MNAINKKEKKNMVKVSFDNLEMLQLYMERIKKANIKEVTVEATLLMTDEVVQKLWNGKAPEETRPSEADQEVVGSKKAKIKSKQRRKNGETKKELVTYFEEKCVNKEAVTVLELINRLNITRSQVSVSLKGLIEEGKIRKVGHGKYELVEEVQTGETKLPEEMEKLKKLYQKKDYRKVLDYIYTKSYFEVDETRNHFLMEDRILVEVIKLSLNAGLIMEAGIPGKKITYKVKPFAKVWFVILRTKRANLDIINAKIHDFSKRQTEKAIEECMEREIIFYESKWGTYSVA